MDDIYSQMTDKFNCDSSNRTDDYFMQVCQPLSSNRCQQIEEIEFKFRQSKQDYVFPRIPFEETPDKYQTIQSPHRLKTEGNEKSEDQLDLNFNFNSSSEHISDDAVVLQPKTYQQKLKPPQPKKPKNTVTQQTYRTILNDLERKLHTINCKDFIKKKYEQKGASRAKSNSNIIINGSISKKNQRPFEIDTKTSSVKKSIPTESKKSLSKTTLAAILLKQKSKSNPSKTNNIFNVNNSHINLNVNINSQTMDLQQQALTVAQILQKKQLLNRSSLSSYQRNSNRCSTEPLEEMKARLSNNHQKNKTTVTNQSRCNTGMDVRAQSTIQYLNQMKKQQIKKHQKQQQQQQIQQKQQPTMQIKPQQNIKQRSSTNTSKPRISSGKYKKYNLSIQMN
ncbi:unnamed protein product [Paramecium pentaurelia]|uniref:Uncharacterized protein n=1 Tax=Paramecium pentaurelia TaxID=43138 RepID=A0A8S1T8G2_9CILI|nr:unnamed protein product [Paramecium pentaurelia]